MSLILRKDGLVHRQQGRVVRATDPDTRCCCISCLSFESVYDASSSIVTPVDGTRGTLSITLDSTPVNSTLECFYDEAVTRLAGLKHGWQPNVPTGVFAFRRFDTMSVTACGRNITRSRSGIACINGKWQGSFVFETTPGGDWFSILTAPFSYAAVGTACSFSIEDVPLQVRSVLTSPPFSVTETITGTLTFTVTDGPC
jgi:hypothetical protein